MNFSIEKNKCTVNNKFYRKSQYKYATKIVSKQKKESSKNNNRHAEKKVLSLCLKTNPNKKSKSLKNAARKEGNCNANVLDGECKNQHVQCTTERESGNLLRNYACSPVFVRMRILA